MPALKRYDRKDQILVKMSEWCDDACLHDICWVLWPSFIFSSKQSVCTYLSACSNDDQAMCMWVSLWQWHETETKTKWVGTNKQKKDKGRGKPSVQTSNISKWLIFCTTKFKGNEQQHNVDKICKWKLIKQN